MGYLQVVLCGGKGRAAMKVELRTVGRTGGQHPIFHPSRPSATSLSIWSRSLWRTRGPFGSNTGPHFGACQELCGWFL